MLWKASWEHWTVFEIESWIVGSLLTREHFPTVQDLMPWPGQAEPDLKHCWNGSLKLPSSNGYSIWCRNARTALVH